MYEKTSESRVVPRTFKNTWQIRGRCEVKGHGVRRWWLGHKQICCRFLRRGFCRSWWWCYCGWARLSLFLLKLKLLKPHLVLTFPFCSVLQQEKEMILLSFSLLIPDKFLRAICQACEKYLRFWYQVLTCVSDSLSASATSERSETERYFWTRNFRSKNANWECVNAVRRRRGFFPPWCWTTCSCWSSSSRSNLSTSMSQFLLVCFEQSRADDWWWWHLKKVDVREPMC